MTKGIFAGLIFAGIISAVLGVLGPLHEVWHWLAAFLQGVDATMGWGVTYIYLPDVNLFIGFIGMFGETSLLTLIFLKLASKKYYKLSVYIFGYTASFSIIIAFFFLGMFVPTDIEVMYGNYNNTIVNLIFYVWMLYYACAMWLQIMYIIYYKTDFFPHLYVDNVIKSLENLDKSVENRENRYKPLTLVK